MSWMNKSGLFPFEQERADPLESAKGGVLLRCAVVPQVAHIDPDAIKQRSCTHTHIQTQNTTIRPPQPDHSDLLHQLSRCRCRMPEYDTYKTRDQDKAAARVHKESGFIAELCTELALQAGGNVWVDGTLQASDTHPTPMHRGDTGRNTMPP